MITITLTIETVKEGLKIEATQERKGGDLAELMVARLFNTHIHMAKALVDSAFGETATTSPAKGASQFPDVSPVSTPEIKPVPETDASPEGAEQ